MTSSQRGGTEIQQWEPDGELWPSMVEAVQAAPHRVGGLVWYQGESDQHTEGALAYEERLNGLISRVRELVGDGELPVVVVQLATTRSENRWGWALVREAQRRVAAADANVGLVPGMDLPVSDSVVHISGGPGGGHNAIGARAGVAALRLAYGVSCASSGPRLESARFYDAGRQVVLLDFFQVSGSIRLTPGWRSGFSSVVVEGDYSGPMSSWPADAPLPTLHSGVINPDHATIVDQDTLALVFASPLEEDAKINWGLYPNGGWGMARGWGMEQAGLTDDSGVPIPAFTLADIAPSSGERLDFDVPTELEPAAYDLTQPFSIAVNIIGRRSESLLGPSEEAGAPGFVQPYWNPAFRFIEPNLVDSQGLITSIGFDTYQHFDRFSEARGEDPNTRMMQTSGDRREHRFVGLVPEALYTLVLYMDPPESRDPQLGYRIADSEWTVTEPDSDPGPGVDREFRGTFVEATEDNGYTGNFLVVRDVAADEHGTIVIEASERRHAPWLSGVQIIYYGETNARNN